MKSTKKIPTIKQIYLRIEEWCDEPDTRQKTSARFFVAWTITIISAILIIAGYVCAWIFAPMVGVVFTFGIILPIALYNLVKWLKWVFSNES